jgi:cysteine desulfurase family protein (TIGR01976 family)
MTSFPIDQVRAQFPALHVTDGGRRRVYLDAPGGTQVCRPAIEAMRRHLEQGTANAGGAFATSAETDALSRAAHEAMADLLGGGADEIAFGPNMTSLTFALSRTLAREWQSGDRIILSRLDHDANVSPWLQAAEDRGVEVCWIDIDLESGTLRLDTLPGLLTDRTQLVAVGGASNALGTVNDIAAIADMVHRLSPALLFVDAVQSVPHVPTDVLALGCDFLACSPYKFFGPHQGVLWGRREAWERLRAYKVRPASLSPAAIRLETGTQSFEGQAGMIGTIDYLEWLGRTLALGRGDSRRERLLAAMHGCLAYEHDLGGRLLDGLKRVNGVTLYGPPTMEGRVPTFGFTIAGRAPRAVAERLGAQGIFAWSGSFYAVEPIERLGLAASGGLVRVGLCHYNSAEEVDELLAELAALG